ncbi:MAG: phosphatidate cytidylyltransferase [Alphaproteobacteria bacterium]|nr:phosphatidate cytidylyltransferase [Alphaproteobacteria bacterium]MBV9373057.1 phosphatidate cytidylyltransferase [Alphaproteobacteria bacterium]MBV9900373.1 phosphatidate cytidylyltransferase [Alphaproteobacteria bacterium]
MSEPAPKAASDLGTRFAAAVVMVALACAAIYLGGWWFNALAAAAAAAMLLEWGDLHGLARPWTYAAMLAAAAALLAAAGLLFPEEQLCYVDDVGVALARQCLDPAWLGFAGLAALGLLLALAARRLPFLTGFLYVTLPALALIALEWASVYFVLWAMLVTWATDIFAYFAGRAIGGPKLAPRISPNKTWAGLLGGMAGAGAVGAAWAIFADLGSPFTWVGALMGLLAQLGDLYESGLKRRFGVKDSGRLIPGHGGVLDRLDGLLPVAAATFLLLWVTLGQ